ncbi:MAG: hypothetical protein Q9199_003316 [Rusavskia elegans]
MLSDDMELGDLRRRKPPLVGFPCGQILAQVRQIMMQYYFAEYPANVPTTKPYNKAHLPKQDRLSVTMIRSFQPKSREVHCQWWRRFGWFKNWRLLEAAVGQL